MTQTPAPSTQAHGQGVGLGFMMVSLLSMQVGNSFAQKLTQAMTTPIGAVWVRMAFAGIILLAMAGVRWLARRVMARRLMQADPATPLRSAQDDGVGGSAQDDGVGGSAQDDGVGAIGAAASALPRDRKAWWFAIAYGAALICMNSSFYEAIARIPVGIVITIEFLGPLAVAILGSRRVQDFIWVALAALGVVILGVTPTHLTVAGVLFSLGAAVCWAGYILLGWRVARHWQGVGVLTGTCVSATVVLLPLFLIGGNQRSLNPSTLWLGLLVALACTVLPYSLELMALKRLPASLFAIIESLAPAVGALAAWLILHQRLHFGDWIAIACIVAASLGASLTAARRAT
ncbi:MAG: EamA family transporter [Propionibacteriaceae bacterium]|nr:EamA family transporter [Propionibacteriaceae bacterium]